jgi:AraC-like DNA-binding protein
MIRQNNICKFVDNSSDSALTIKNFVFEKELVNKANLPSRYCIYLVISGKGILKTEVGEHPLTVGDIFFTFAGVPFSIKDLGDLNYMFITFEGERGALLISRFNITPHNCVFKGHEQISAFWQSAIVKANEKNLDLISESVLLWTLGEMTSSSPEQNENLIANIIKYVEQNFADYNLNLATVSETLGYNSKYLSRIFKKAMGISFSVYLTNTRIQNAVFLIEQGVTSIKNISFLSGYKDPFYFSNVFKSIIGFSPSEFIANMEEKKEPQ